jgi:UDP-N-acetylmuramyl pentapeptide phosphotransferase/UDP-N-acetylglucosamine-1-phosphate transferase
MLFLVLLASALLSAALIVLLRPVLVRYALARPNARSSHMAPTPQGGGIAVTGAALLSGGAALTFLAIAAPALPVIVIATLALALVGAVDDIRPLPALPRFMLQTIAVLSVVVVSGVRFFADWVPGGVETALVVFAGLWFVNLVNFMDGLDWITVAEMIPLTAFVAAAGFFGFLPFPVTVLGAALCGALLGFAPFNKPVARLFLGDVGSLPIGLLVGWMLLELAGTGAVAAAFLLPMYHLMDATITLLKRLGRGERVWEAHRSHFYQRATVNGFSALSVSVHVLGLNLVLAALAAATLVRPIVAVQIGALGLGILLTALLLRRFATPRVKALS